MKYFLLLLLVSCAPKKNPAIFRIKKLYNDSCRYYYYGDFRDSVAVSYYAIDDVCGKWKINDTIK